MKETNSIKSFILKTLTWWAFICFWTQAVFNCPHNVTAFFVNENVKTVNLDMLIYFLIFVYCTWSVSFDKNAFELKSGMVKIGRIFQRQDRLNERQDRLNEEFAKRLTRYGWKS